MIGRDDYPYRGDPVDTPDPWQFLKRECTSFVAWRINNDLHVPFQNSYQGQWFGNAKDWAAAAQRAGVRVDGTPGDGRLARRQHMGRPGRAGTVKQAPRPRHHRHSCCSINCLADCDRSDGRRARLKSLAVCGRQSVAEQ